MGEEGFVLASGDNLTAEILGEFSDEDRMRELLEKYGREIKVAVKTDPISLEVPKNAEQRQIGLGDSFVEPLHAMRPGAVIDHVRQVGMEREREKSCCRS